MTNFDVKNTTLPYKIAVLCYLFDEDGQVLLLHRRRPPNQDLYSPVGGKLEQGIGESPTTCAVREIYEETGLTVTASDLHLTGIVSEAGFDDRMHWLMFLYEVTHPVKVTRTSFDEGTLEWHSREKIGKLPIPHTDRDVIWPQFWAHRGGFFMAHIDCHKGSTEFSLEQSYYPGE
ncbi:NUDIX hydrolase [Poriferisphaera sp. WC338]|uniref:NUDIX hydrolase n=1 Tax=Poriferisphaera sp. WC338 TaxID=3425129 RepID=UPI003D81A92C